MSIQEFLPWGLVGLLALVAGYLGIRLFRTIREYKPIIEVDGAIRKRKREVDRLEAEAAKLRAEHDSRVTTLRDEYAQKKKVFEELGAQVRLYEESLEAASFGLYEPHFAHDSSEEYKVAIRERRDAQKKLVADDEAAFCGKSWTIEGSEAKGRAATKRFKKLLIRGFNGECDGLIAKVSWDNAARMGERIQKSFAALNKLGDAAHATQITPAYLALKIQEMELTYEHQMKRQQEREEQRAIREQMKEKERADREIQKALRDAEIEEQRKAEALEKARAEAAEATGEKLAALQARINGLADELADAHTKNERAKSQAQLTKAGYVYVVSNIGSFGEDVFKVGMTRRLEPMDRVKELGDASVPFEFDVHAMIWSEDAPGFEAELHSRLNERRVNKVNHRKEFFRVSLRELQDIARENDARIEFTLLAQAREYRETLAIEAEGSVDSTESRVAAFPAEL